MTVSKKAIHAYLRTSPASQEYENAIDSITKAMQTYLHLPPEKLRKYSRDMLLMNPANIPLFLANLSVSDFNCQTKITEVVRNFKKILLSHAYQFLYKKSIKDEEAAEMLGVSRRKVVQTRINLGYVPVKKKTGWRSYDTPAKNIVRNEYFKFIQESISKPMNLVKVLCLPGVEASLELGIYDKLGIPRRNIVGVEIQTKKFKIIKQLDLNINLKKGDIGEFLKNTQQKFDIINLDFAGYFSHKYLDCVTTIFERDILEGRGVLSMTYLGGREKTPSKNLMIEESLTMIVDELFSPELEPNLEDLIKKYDEVRKGEVIPREDIDYTLAKEGYMAKFRKKISELGFPLTRDGVTKALESCEDVLLNALEDSYLLQKARRIWYRSGRSPMQAVFMYFEKGVRKYENYLVARAELRRQIKEKIPQPEKLIVNGEMRKVVGSPRKLTPELKKKIEEDIRKRLSKKIIAIRHGVSEGQVSAIKAWMTMRGEKVV